MDRTRMGGRSESADKKAIENRVTDDVHRYVLLETGINPVMARMIAGGIEITVKLAKGLRAALDKTASTKS